MIESITVTNYLGESIEMVLTQPELSGFIVKSIDGIGPANANINMMELATIDGSIFNSARLNTRDISLSLLYTINPDIGINNIEEARRKSYKYFPVKKPVTLTFKTDAEINGHNPIHVLGYVEKNEPKIFQKQEGTTISIKCADPYFHSESYTKKMFYGVDPLFEFTYWNDSDQLLNVSGNEYDHIPYTYYTIDNRRTSDSYRCDESYDKITIKFKTYASNMEDALCCIKVSRVQGDPNYINMVGRSVPIYENDDFVLSVHQNQATGDNAIWVIADRKVDTPSNVYDIMTAEVVQGSSGTVLVGDDTEFGNINYVTEGNVIYAGEAETGMVLEIHAIGSAKGVEFYDVESGDKMSLSDDVIIDKTGLGISAGDVITMDTTRGHKTVTLLRDGITYDILNALIQPINWFKLNNGNNVFTYAAEEGLEYLIFTVTYDELYEGV